MHVDWCKWGHTSLEETFGERNGKGEGYRGRKGERKKGREEMERNGSYHRSDFELRTFIEFLISSFRSRERERMYDDKQVAVS